MLVDVSRGIAELEYLWDLEVETKASSGLWARKIVPVEDVQ